MLMEFLWKNAHYNRGLLFIEDFIQGSEVPHHHAPDHVVQECGENTD